jgi:Disulphide bond corrector protein DsbC
MTEEARRVFVNTIVYMKQFDGAVQTVRRGLNGRDTPMEVIGSPDLTTAHLTEWIPDDLLAQTGGDGEKLKAIYEGKEGFIWVPLGTSALSVDEDVLSLGIPNNDIRLLEKCIGQLDDESVSARARRVLTRYTGLAFEGQAEWTDWLKANREKLYFSDSYGYRFFTGPAGPGPTQDHVRNVVAELVQPDTTEVAPVSVAAGFATAKDLPYAGIGDRLTLVVRMRIRDGWHTYASAPEGNPMIPTRLDVKLPSGLHWAGEWRMSTAPSSREKDKKGGSVEQQGDVLFVRSLHVAGMPEGENGKVTVRGELQFQSCNELKCLPPATLPVEGQVTIR